METLDKEKERKTPLLENEEGKITLLLLLPLSYAIST
jgi:hypothetical protein